MEDSRKGKRDGEKELSTPSPHVDDEKGKKAIVYETKKKEEKGSGKIRSLGHVRRDSSLKTTLIALAFFTLKSNILAQDSD